MASVAERDRVLAVRIQNRKSEFDRIAQKAGAVLNQQAARYYENLATYSQIPYSYLNVGQNMAQVAELARRMQRIGIPLDAAKGFLALQDPAQIQHLSGNFAVLKRTWDAYRMAFPGHPGSAAAQFLSSAQVSALTETPIIQNLPFGVPGGAATSLGMSANLPSGSAVAPGGPGPSAASGFAPVVRPGAFRPVSTSGTIPGNSPASVSLLPATPGGYSPASVSLLPTPPPDHQFLSVVGSPYPDRLNPFSQGFVPSPYPDQLNPFSEQFNALTGSLQDLRARRPALNAGSPASLGSLGLTPELLARQRAGLSPLGARLNAETGESPRRPRSHQPLPRSTQGSPVPLTSVESRSEQGRYQGPLEEADYKHFAAIDQQSRRIQAAERRRLGRDLTSPEIAEADLDAIDSQVQQLMAPVVVPPLPARRPPGSNIHTLASTRQQHTPEETGVALGNQIANSLGLGLSGRHHRQRQPWSHLVASPYRRHPRPPVRPRYQRRRR